MFVILIIVYHNKKMYKKQYKIKRNKKRDIKNGNSYFGICNVNHNVNFKNNTELLKKIDDSVCLSPHHKTLMKKYINNPENIYMIHTYWNTLWKNFETGKSTIIYPTDDKYVIDFYNIWINDLWTYHNKNNICICNNVFVTEHQKCENVFCNSCVNNYIKNGIICKNSGCESYVFINVVMKKYEKYINDGNIKMDKWIELYKELKKWINSEISYNSEYVACEIYKKIVSKKTILEICRNETDINNIPFKLLLNIIDVYIDNNNISIMNPMLKNIFKYINDNPNKNSDKLMKKFIISSIKNNGQCVFLDLLEDMNNFLLEMYGPKYKRFIELFFEIRCDNYIIEEYGVSQPYSLWILENLLESSIHFGKYENILLVKYLEQCSYYNVPDYIVKRIVKCDKNEFKNKYLKMIHTSAKYFNRIMTPNGMISFGYMLDILNNPSTKYKLKSGKIVAIVKPLPNYLIAKIFSYIL